MANLEHWCFAWFEAGLADGRDRQGLWLSSRWTPGGLISISFLDGDPSLHARVEKAARQWIAPGRAHLFFDFRADTLDTDVRISFSHPGSWSVLGTTCRRISKPAPTMNFGWLSADTPDAELERVVLHEFGHALGLVHEHQLPLDAIPWDREAVYRDLEPRWSKERIEQNIFATVSDEALAMSHFDPTSIMAYPIKESWTQNRVSIGLNARLSAKDIAFIRNIYG